jgi:hypothetical protein
MVAAPNASLRALAPGAEGWLALAWANWCPPGTRITSSGPAPHGLVLSLPHQGGVLRFAVDDAPRCDAPTAASILQVGSFLPREHDPPRSTHLPLRVSFPGVAHPLVKLRPPDLKAPRGGVLRYEIGLTNVSRHDFRFRSCPVYVQHFLDGSRTRSYVLNCGPAGTFAPGERKIFAMELPIPRTARLGTDGFTWKLGPRTWEPPWAPASVLVTR